MFSILKRILRPLRGKGLCRIPGAKQAYRFVFGKILSRGLVLTEVQGSKMYLDLSDRHVSIGLFLDSIYEKGTTELFNRLVEPGMVVLDIGAHIGYYALLSSKKVKEKGKVYAFEPNPANYELLFKNIQVNNYQNIVPINKALSNRVGRGSLYLSSENRGDHRIYDSQDHRPAVEIEMTTVDEFFKDKEPRIDLIKIDTQGAEMAIFTGMHKSLEKNPHLRMIVEFWPFALKKFGYSPVDSLALIRRLGFQFKLIEDNGLKAVTEDIILSRCGKEESVNLYLER